MSVNRRNFLKLLSAATVGLISDPLSTVIAHNHIYVNKHLGIAFKAPIDWHFYTTHSIKRMHDAQIMRADRAEIEDLVHELKNQPLVALGRDPSDPGYVY